MTARIEIPANIAVYYPAHAHMYMWQVRIRMSSRRSRCGHCEKLVSEKTFKEHHRLFYHDGQWMTEHTRPSDDASSRDSSPLSLQFRSSQCKVMWSQFQDFWTGGGQWRHESQHSGKYFRRVYEWWVLSCIYSAHRYLVIKLISQQSKWSIGMMMSLK